MKKQLDTALDRTVRLEMMRALDRIGHEVTFVTGYRYRQDDFGMGDRIRYLRSSRLPLVNHVLFSADVSRMLPRLAVALQPDAVILDAWTIRAGARWIKQLRRAEGSRPLIVADVRTLPVGFSGLKKLAAEWFFTSGIGEISRLCDCVSVITECMRETLVERYGLTATLPHAVWTSAVSPEVFDPNRFDDSTRARTREELGIPPTAILLMYHGSITRQRGLGELMDALAGASTAARDIHLLLVGAGPDLTGLLDQAAVNGLEKRVHYVPSVPHDRLPALIDAADVGVLPLPDSVGWRVSSPIKLFEYLSMAKPVIVTSIAAHREVLGDSSCAFWAGDGSARSLAEAIGRAAQPPATTLLHTGSLGRGIALNGFTWDQQAAKLANMLSDCPRRRA